MQIVLIVEKLPEVKGKSTDYLVLETWVMELLEFNLGVGNTAQNIVNTHFFIVNLKVSDGVKRVYSLLQQLH